MQHCLNTVPKDISKKQKHFFLVLHKTEIPFGGSLFQDLTSWGQPKKVHLTGKTRRDCGLSSQLSCMHFFFSTSSSLQQANLVDIFGQFISKPRKSHFLFAPPPPPSPSHPFFKYMWICLWTVTCTYTITLTHLLALVLVHQNDVQMLLFIVVYALSFT